MSEHDDLREQVARAIAGCDPRSDEDDSLDVGIWKHHARSAADAALAVMLPALDVLRSERDAARAEVARLREANPDDDAAALARVIRQVEAAGLDWSVGKNNVGDCWASVGDDPDKWGHDTPSALAKALHYATVNRHG